MGVTYMAINTTKKQYFEAGEKHGALYHGVTASLLAYLLYDPWGDDIRGSWIGDAIEIIPEHDPRIDELELLGDSFYDLEDDWEGPKDGWTDITRDLQIAWNGGGDGPNIWIYSSSLGDDWPPDATPTVDEIKQVAKARKERWRVEDEAGVGRVRR